MKRVMVLGAGKVGKSVAELLLACAGDDWTVTVGDREEGALREVEGNLARLRSKVRHPVQYATRRVDVGDPASVRAALSGQDYVICMLPFDVVAGIAEMANELGVHYFDATEDVETTDRIRAIDRSGRAKVALVPQCGLAPGYIAIAAYDLARGFAQVDDLRLRVGALPQYPTNALKYNVTWSAAGVVNEYCEPCNVMLDGQVVKVPALEGLEAFSFEGLEYEAFYTSGGVGTLIETLTAEKKTTDQTTVAYKTIRYPGHCAIMKVLLQDLRLGVEHAAATRDGTVFDRGMAVKLMEYALPRTLQDMVVIFINCIGTRPGTGRREQVNFRRSIRAAELFGRVWPAIELTTAAGVCAMVDLHRLGKLRQTGFVRQEEVTLAAFNQTPFGAAYEDPAALEKAAVGRIGPVVMGARATPA